MSINPHIRIHNKLCMFYNLAVPQLLAILFSLTFLNYKQHYDEYQSN